MTEYRNIYLQYPTQRMNYTDTAVDTSDMTFQELVVSFFEAAARLPTLENALNSTERKLVYPLETPIQRIEKKRPAFSFNVEITMDYILNRFDRAQDKIRYLINLANEAEQSLVFPKSRIAKEVFDRVAGKREYPDAAPWPKSADHHAQYSADRDVFIADLRGFLGQVKWLDMRIAEIATAIDRPQSDEAQEIKRHWVQYASQAYTPSLATCRK